MTEAVRELDPLQDSVVRLINFAAKNTRKGKQLGAGRILGRDKHYWSRVGRGVRVLKTEDLCTVAASLEMQPFYVSIPFLQPLDDLAKLNAVENAQLHQRVIALYMTLSPADQRLIAKNVELLHETSFRISGRVATNPGS